MAARLPGGLPRGPRVIGLFPGTVTTHAPSCLYRQLPTSTAATTTTTTMRLSLRRRRVPEASRREYHQQSRQRPRNPQGSKIQWYSIPVSVGIGVVGFLHLYKSYKTTGKDLEPVRIEQQEQNERPEIQEERSTKRPKKRPRVRPDGPW